MADVQPEASGQRANNAAPAAAAGGAASDVTPSDASTSTVSSSARTEEGGCALLLGGGRETSGLKSLLARPECAMAQNPPSGVVCPAGVEDACSCLVSLIQLPSYGDRTVKVALRS